MQQSKRRTTTVQLKPSIAKAIKAKAARLEKSVSDVVNALLAERIKEDQRHLKIYRARQHEVGRPLEDVMRDMERDGLL